MLRIVILLANILFTASCAVSPKNASTPTFTEDNTRKDSSSSKDEPAGSLYEEGRAALFNPADRKDYAKATDLLQSAVEKSPNNAAASLMLAYAYIKQNRYEDAQPRIETARRLQGQLSDKDNLWLEALDARVADESVRERAAWAAIVKADPRDRWAWYELASVLYRSESYEGSVSAIEDALKTAPDEQQWGASYIYYLHSKALFRLGRYDEAVAAAAPGVRNPATRRATFYRKAMAQVASGAIIDPSEALATYREYSKKNGAVNEAVYQANVALFFFELGDYENAIAHARKAYALSQGPYQTWVLGYALTEHGDPKAGLSYLEKAADTPPRNTNVLAGVGWAYYRLGQFEKAHEFFLAARAASPRKNSGVERDIKIVENALANPDAPQAPPARWFGD